MTESKLREGLSLLKRRDFAKLFTAYFISYSGTAMAPIAMAFGVLDLTGSTRDSAYVIAAPVVAQIALILIGGAIADRTSRQRMLVAARHGAACLRLWAPRPANRERANRRCIVKERQVSAVR